MSARSMVNLGAIAPLGDYLTFQGTAFLGGNPQEFSALCGDDPPVITDGYARWTNLQRPLFRDVTIPQGFNAGTMKVTLRFGIWDGRFGWTGWDTRDDAGSQVEKDIGVLEWMAGVRQKKKASPIVYASSYSAQTGAETNLIPPQYRGSKWVINGGIAWGKIIRNKSGHRVMAECNFSLLNYLGFDSPPPASTELQGGYFITTPLYNTALAIAAHPSSRSPAAFQQFLAGRICSHPSNNPIKGTRTSLTTKGIHWKIPNGYSVWVPSHAT